MNPPYDSHQNISWQLTAEKSFQQTMAESELSTPGTRAQTAELHALNTVKLFLKYINKN